MPRATAWPSGLARAVAPQVASQHVAAVFRRGEMQKFPDGGSVPRLEQSLALHLTSRVAPTDRILGRWGVTHLPLDEGGTVHCTQDARLRRLLLMLNQHSAADYARAVPLKSRR